MKSAFVLGSCVTRDGFEVEGASALTCSDYFARTSLVSLMSPPIPLERDDFTAANNFSRKAISRDFDKSFFDAVEQSEFDLFVIDFIDERFPLVERDGSYLTLSHEMERSGLIEGLPEASISRFSMRVDNLWRSSCAMFAERLRVALRGRPVAIHRAMWAGKYRTKTGETVPFDEGWSKKVEANNRLLTSYYDLLRGALPGSVEVSLPELTIADENHKWGLHAIHYVPSYYETLYQRLEEIALTGKVGASQVAPEPKPTPRAPSPAQTSKMNRPLVGAGTEQVGGVKRSPFREAHDWDGTYLDHHLENVFRFRDASIVADENGIPQNSYRWGGPYYYIVTIGHYGLECFSKYVVLGEAEALDRAAKVVDWLRQNQDEAGGWPVAYDHNWYPGRTEIIKAPWYCAMGQGLAMSFLARMYAKTGDASLLPIMIDAAKVFRVPSHEGGVLAHYHGHPWYEEYPTKPSSFVLNGYIYALLGLHDAAKATGDAGLQELYETGIESLRAMLSLYDLGWCTAYDLTHHSVPGAAPNVARWQYHWIHVQLLSALDQIEDGMFSSYTDRWYQYLFGARVQQN